jgi:hypothetical protein
MVIRANEISDPAYGRPSLAAADASRLRELEQTDRIFELRRALGVSQISAKCLLLIGAGKAAAQNKPNLFFDELRSLMEIRHRSPCSCISIPARTGPISYPPYALL